MTQFTLNDYLEDKLARTRKKKRPQALRIIYHELFCGHNKNSFYRSNLEELDQKEQERFMGFFCDRLEEYRLEHLAKATRARFGNVERIEVRWQEDGTNYRMFSWGIRADKKLLALETDRKNTVDYLEIRVGDKIYGGKDLESFAELQEPSLVVREELQLLPKKFTKKLNEYPDTSQFSVLQGWPYFNKLRMAITYLQKELGVTANNFELRKAGKELVEKDWKTIEQYHLNNQNGKLLLEDKIKQIKT